MAAKFEEKTIPDDDVWLVNAPQYLMAIAMKNYAMSVRDKSLLIMAEQQVQKERQVLLARHVEWEASNKNLVKGG